MDIGIRTENNIDGGNIFFDFVDCCGIICLNEEGDKMFEPFCRYDGGDKGFGWRGLRLAIANHTAKTRGCELSVAINPGRGFVFSLVLSLIHI